VEAIGGRIFLDSPLGAGTSLRVELPITAANGDVAIPDVRLPANTHGRAGALVGSPENSSRGHSGGKVIVGDPGGSVLAPPRSRLTTTMAPFRPFLSPASGQLELPPASMANGRWR
jgi:hypothetical protein